MSLGLLWRYFATSGAKSDVIFLLGDPDFVPVSVPHDAGPTDDRRDDRYRIAYVTDRHTDTQIDTCP